MALAQTSIDSNTPMGANLVAGGATFKVWAPTANGVYLNGEFSGTARWTKDTDPTLLLTKDSSSGYWTGFLPGVVDGDLYKYYVVGETGGTAGYKRDPYARELTDSATYPVPDNCIIRASDSYPWHDQSFVTPDFSDLIIYQLHVGTYAPAAFPNYGTFLDVIEKIPYLVSLGINMLQPLPVTETEGNPNWGYQNVDIFSPDTVYTVSDPTALTGYLATINNLLSAKGLTSLTLAEISTGLNQLKAMVDLCHVYGIAVAFDVIYNHAGGFYGDDECTFFWDRQAGTNDVNNSLYYHSGDMGSGGLSFALWKTEVRAFLIDNAKFFFQECHVDGLRYDEISVLLATNVPVGWTFCQDLTNTVRYVHNRALQNAEYWPSEFSASVYSIVQPASQGGTGFDTVQHDALRTAIRAAVQQASYGASASVDMNAIQSSLYPPGLPNDWNAVPSIENQDLVHVGRSPRIPALADGSNSRSFYARSRSKWATGLLLAAPGIPQLFMGQEFLEDKPWDELPGGSHLIYWAGLNSGDKSMSDQLRFTQDFIRLRWLQPALRGQKINPYYSWNPDRVIAFHRWIDGEGKDVVVVASLNDSPFFNYQLGFPVSGHWSELFNSDVYDNWVNPLAVGNYGGVWANGGPMHNLPYSASITIPPRSILVFGIG
jgi:1,4-alpha-glucan branching enzyme